MDSLPVEPSTVGRSTTGEAARGGSALPYSPRTAHPTPSALRRKSGSITGWLVGIVCGIVAGLWAFPPVRYTLSAQFQLALAQDSIPWMRALDADRVASERPRLDSVAAASPDDRLLQVGRATILADSGPRDQNSDKSYDRDDRTLLRLGFVAKDFPDAAGSYAHLARYMMLERVRIQRKELEATPATSKRGAQTAPPSDPTVLTVPARRKDVRMMEWALRSGEARDPDNAFWPAALAVTYFAALRDDEGLSALHRASRKQRWDAYLYEQVLGQWRLYSAAYGDNGATQKIGPLSFVAFPHLRELRHMAELVRLKAEEQAQQGHDRQALQMRRDLGRLGLILRDSAQWAYEALYGTDLFLIAHTDSGVSPIQDGIRTVKAWRQKAPQYLALLRRTHRSNRAWLENEVQACCDLRTRVDAARFDASYPGAPPGIPLVPLFGNWMAGICLLQQILALTVAALLAAMLHRSRIGRMLSRSSFAGALLYLGLLTTAFTSGWLLFFGVPSMRGALMFLTALTLLFVLGMQTVFHLQTHRFSRYAVDAAESPDVLEMRWNHATTARMLALLLIPGLTILYLARPALSELHPVAVLLSSLMGSPHVLTIRSALKMGALAGALPLALLTACSLWALYRRVAPLRGAIYGLRRMALPAVACLTFAYLLLLGRTLRLDATASGAINEAAHNDLQWVLTHSEPAEE